MKSEGEAKTRKLGVAIQFFVVVETFSRKVVVWENQRIGANEYDARFLRPTDPFPFTRLDSGQPALERFVFLLKKKKF
jgi:hypothetical protein